MTDIIQLLPDALANQIAAGEVVQRPASVVKELMENAIDAGAQRLQVIIGEAGKSLIQVIDDGQGMSETDARMCFERHATSKIRTSQDLFAIRTLGFRGEAMASIAAVAQVELKSRRPADELATLVRIEGSEVKGQEAAAASVGTSVAVKNLFFNVPARRKFLKSPSVEMRHILDEFVRVALAHPDLGFSLHQNDLEVYQLSEGKLSQRIVALFGPSYKAQLVRCAEETPLVNVRGYVGKPAHARRARGEQFFFVNERYVRHPYLHHAVVEAYGELLPDDTHPFYVLFIEIDPAHVDINVHPTKTEVKFDDERTLYAIVRAAVKKALGVYNIVPPLDFEQDVNLTHLMHLGQAPAVPTEAQSPAAARPGPPQLARQASNQRHWEQLYQDLRRENPPHVPGKSLTKASQVSGEAPTEKLSSPVGERRTMQVHAAYIVAQVRSGMVLIDQQAAHERILYEKYRQHLQQRVGISQQLLFPQAIDLSAADMLLVDEMADDLRALGFEFSPLGPQTLMLHGLPADGSSGQEKQWFEGVLAQLRDGADAQLPRPERLARALARRAALRPGTPLTDVAMNALIDQLFACQTARFAPDGRPTFLLLSLPEVAGLFQSSRRPPTATTTETA